MTRDEYQQELMRESQRFWWWVKRIVFGVLAAVLLLIVLFGSCYSVDQGEQAVVLRFGAVADVSGPGLHGKLPLVDSIRTISTRTEYVEWGLAYDESGKATSDSSMGCYSHDQQLANISVKVAYRVRPDAAAVRDLYSRFRDVSTYANRIIIPRTQQAVKATFGQFTAVKVVQTRAQFNEQAEAAVRALIAEAAEGDGGSLVIIDAVNFQNIDFSDAYEHAIEERMKAEVEVAKITQNLERERKQAEILVVQAEAKAKSVRLAGEAAAAAIRARSDALRDSPRLVELTLAEKWDGKLPSTMVPSGAVPFLGSMK